MKLIGFKVTKVQVQLLVLSTLSQSLMANCIISHANGKMHRTQVPAPCFRDMSSFINIPCQASWWWQQYMKSTTNIEQKQAIKDKEAQKLEQLCQKDLLCRITNVHSKP